MKADGPRLDGTATAAGTEEGRVGRVLHLPVCRRRVVGGLKKKAAPPRSPGKRRAGRGPPQPAVLVSWMMISGPNSLTRLGLLDERAEDLPH